MAIAETKTLVVIFTEVVVLDDSDFWGDGEWSFDVTVDGHRVGDESREFLAVRNRAIQFDRSWSKRIDVTRKRPGDQIKIVFKALERDTLSDDDLGKVEVTLKYPFKQDLLLKLPGSRVDGTRYFELDFSVIAVPEDIVEDLNYEPAYLLASRGDRANGVYTAMSMDAFVPRAEVCPVVPTPPAAELPPRPRFPAAMPGGRIMPRARGFDLTADPPLNAVWNPSFVPVLSESDSRLDEKAARVGITYLEPALAPSANRNFHWHIKRGQLAFVGPNVGVSEIMLRGTGIRRGGGDQEGIVELHWSDPSGPLLATFRTWVGRVKQIPFRVQIVRGTTREAQPNPSSGDVARHVSLANTLFWQSGLTLEPDSDDTVWDGARKRAPGIFVIQLREAAQNEWTKSLHSNLTPVVTRLNHRPNIVNICYVHSIVDAGGVATDHPRLSGEYVFDTGSPSSSWRQKSGLRGDTPADAVRMRSLYSSRRDLSLLSDDEAYMTGRGFNTAGFQNLFACILQGRLQPDSYWYPYTIAHEVGHVLGLRHRGSGGYKDADPRGGGEDEVNDPSTGHGHPWNQNIMSYGYETAQNFDLIQTYWIRRHPCLVET